MKKAFVVLSLAMFVGSMGATVYAMNSNNIEVVKKGDDDKKKKKKKGESCCADKEKTEAKASCSAKKTEGKSCCASKAAAEKK